MAEPDELDYGRYCQHGTNIGTPGGSDYLCGLCEDGLNKRVPVTIYGACYAVAYLDNPYKNEWPTLKGYGSEAEMRRAVETMSAEMDHTNRLALQLGMSAMILVCQQIQHTFEWGH